jgi:hypothetical protein
VSLGAGRLDAVAFVVCMLIGMFCVGKLEARRSEGAPPDGAAEPS